jgi:TetR/AcrR family tetracycline transcriptional repressor
MPVHQEDAVRVALRLLDESGLEKLTLRRIAVELEVQAPALYWHFRNKRALLDHMTDKMLDADVAALGAPKPDAVWWEWLDEAAMLLRRALLAHSDGARVASGANLNNAVALGTLLDRTIEVLHSAGFEWPDAARAGSGLLWFVIGRTLEEQSQPSHEDVRILMDGDRFPALAEAVRHGYGKPGSAEETFTYSVGIMIAGLRATAESP